MNAIRSPFASAALALLLVTSSPGPAAAAPATSKPVASAPAAGTPARTVKPLTMRGAASLPSLSSFGRVTGPLSGSFFSTTDTFLVQSHGFQDLDGTCQPRGWTATDKTAQVFAHVSDRFVVNHSAFAGHAFAGSGGPTYPAPLSQALVDPTEVAVNDSGRIVYTDGDVYALKVIETYPAANLARVIASGVAGIAETMGMTVDPITHGLLISCTAPDRILLVPSGGGAPTQFAGGGGTTADTTVAAAAIQASGIAADAAGNVYFAELGTSRIRMIRRNDMRVVTLAGDGTMGFGGDGGPALSAQLSNPFGVALNPAGTELFFCDNGNHRVRHVDLTTGIITTIAGGPSVFSAPHTIAYSGGTLYVTATDPADFSRIYKIVGSTVSVAVGDADFFGPPSGSNQGQQLTLQAASFNTASRLASDNAGGCYFAAKRLIYHLHADGHLEVVTGEPMSVLMGTQALWFGADSTSAPDEVDHWVNRSGHGSGWSQRFTSPQFDRGAHPAARLEFDMAIALSQAQFAYALSNNAVVVEGQRADGTWESLIAQYQVASSGADNLYTAVLGVDVVHVRVDVTSGINLGSTTRLRILVQTQDVDSAEDGSSSARPFGAAVIDNVSLRDGGLDLVAPVNFEDGTTGAWTLSAQNGAYTSGGDRKDPARAARAGHHRGAAYQLRSRRPLVRVDLPGPERHHRSRRVHATGLTVDSAAEQARHYVDHLLGQAAGQPDRHVRHAIRTWQGGGRGAPVLQCPVLVRAQLGLRRQRRDGTVLRPGRASIPRRLPGPLRNAGSGLDPDRVLDRGSYRAGFLRHHLLAHLAFHPPAVPRRHSPLPARRGLGLRWRRRLARRLPERAGRRPGRGWRWLSRSDRDVPSRRVVGLELAAAALSDVAAADPGDQRLERSERDPGRGQHLAERARGRRPDQHGPRHPAGRGLGHRRDQPDHVPGSELCFLAERARGDPDALGDATHILR
jgi:hypothetical protein